MLAEERAFTIKRERAMLPAKREPHPKKNNHISKVCYLFDFALLITGFIYLI
jgi:hypothetical protein